MGIYDQMPTLISPEDVKKTMKDINEARSHLLTFVSTKGEENIKFSELSSDRKRDIDMKIDSIINSCDSESKEGEFGKKLTEVSLAYNNLKDLIYNSNLGMTLSQIKNQLNILSQPRGADADLKEFVSSMN